MPKSRKNEEKAPERTYTAVGDPCNGYTICEKGKPTQVHFAKMWDAIECRDALNAGQSLSDFEWDPAAV